MGGRGRVRLALSIYRKGSCARTVVEIKENCLAILPSGYAGIRFLRYKYIHKDEMAHATTHNKQVENFVRTKKFMLCVKNRKLQ